MCYIRMDVLVRMVNTFIVLASIPLRRLSSCHSRQIIESLESRLSALQNKIFQLIFVTIHQPNIHKIWFKELLEGIAKSSEDNRNLKQTIIKWSKFSRTAQGPI